MPLVKEYERVLIERVPEQPARDEQTVCTTTPPPGTGSGSGQWQRRCTTLVLPANASAPVNMGTSVTVLSVANGYVTYQICTSVWVPSGSGSGGESGGPVTCTTLPAQPYIPEQPARIDTVPIFDWQAGANSIQELEGDAFLTFDMPVVIGTIVGFTDNRDDAADRDRITHGMYFGLDGAGDPIFQVFEAGSMMTEPAPYTAGDYFKITREAGVVKYHHYNTGSSEYERIYTSTTINGASPLIAASAMYASGDTIP